MYAEKILTPHPLKKQPEQYADVLTDTLDLHSVAKELDHLRHTGVAEFDQARIDVADMVSRSVNRALWYPVDGDDSDDYDIYGIEYPITLDSLDDQFANCYGYTFVTSELLDSAGIEHWIGYSSGLMNHAFILLPPANKQTDGVYFIDSLLPQLNHPLDRSIQRSSLRKMRQDIETIGRSAFMLDAQIFSDEINEKYDELSAAYPWLVYAKDRSCFHRDTKTSKKYDRKHQLVTTVHSSEVGREVVDWYGRYQQASHLDDYQRAADLISRMQGVYPNIDARQNHTDVHHLVDWLCEHDKQDQALTLIQEYFSSFEFSHDTRIAEAKADMHMRVANRTGSLAVAETAELIYLDTVNKKQCFRGRIESKIDRVKSMKSELAARG